MSDSLRNEFLKSIGEMTVLFSRLEFYIAHFIGEFISQDYELDRIVVAGEQMTNLMVLFESLVRYRIIDEKELKRFDAIINNIGKVKAERNKIIHSDWIIANFENSLIARRSLSNKRNKKRLTLEYKDVELQSMNDLIKQIDEVIRDIIHFMTDNRAVIEKHRNETAKKNIIRLHPI